MVLFNEKDRKIPPGKEGGVRGALAHHKNQRLRFAQRVLFPATVIARRLRLAMSAQVAYTKKQWCLMPVSGKYDIRPGRIACATLSLKIIQRQIALLHNFFQNESVIQCYSPVEAFGRLYRGCWIEPN